MNQERLYTMVSSNYLDGLCAMVSEAISKGWEPQGSPFRAEREGYPEQPQHWYQAMVRRPVKGLAMAVEETAGTPKPITFTGRSVLLPFEDFPVDPSLHIRDKDGVKWEIRLRRSEDNENTQLAARGLAHHILNFFDRL